MMSNDQIVNELKEKKLPTFGTAVERKDRLKKHFGNRILNNIIFRHKLSQFSGATGLKRDPIIAK